MRGRREAAVKLHALRCGHGFDADHHRRIAHHVAQAARAVGRHGHMVLLVGGGGQAGHAAGVGQALVLGGQGSGGDLRNHETRVHAAVADEEGGQAREAGVEQQDRRRSEMAPISATASAMMSATKATGSAWKLPPEITSPLLNTSGLSDAAFASMARTRAAWCRLSRHAPITCGTQRIEYGSCTRPQCGVRVDGAAVEQRAHGSGDRDLPHLAARFVDAGVKRFDRALMASSDRQLATRAAANTSPAPNRPASASAGGHLRH